MKTVFIRAIEAAVDEKAAVLREAAQAGAQSRFDADVSTFSQVPRSPFAYWANQELLKSFTTRVPLQAEGRYVRQGLVTADDFRFFRLAWEVPAFQASGAQPSWVPLSKGGAYARYYSDLSLVVTWGARQPELEAFGESRGNAARSRQSSEFYFRPGFTWPRRTQGGLSFRAMPRGCIFADKGLRLLLMTMTLAFLL